MGPSHAFLNQEGWVELEPSDSGCSPLADQSPFYLGLPTEVEFSQYSDLRMESLQRQIDSFIFATKYGTKKYPNSKLSHVKTALISL